MKQILRHFAGLCVLFQAMASSGFAADPRWIRMASDDFEIFSTAGEGDTRRALEQFQQVSGFFASASKSKLATNDPIRIIIFGSKKEYEPYKPNEVAIAYYTQSGGRDYIVLGNVGDDAAFHVAVHEYVHLIAQHGGLKLPPWLNEGVAELYSTLRPQGGEILVGEIIPGRMQTLAREKWVPLSVILAADHNSPYYNEKNRAGSLYNEGWALTHMLTLSKDFSDGYSKVVAEIQAGIPSQQALEKVYGKPLDAIEKNLQAYLRGDRLFAALFDIKLVKTKERLAAEPASLFDVKLALLDLTNRPGKQAETQSRLEALVSDDPRRPEPHVALGYLAWRTQEREKAAAHFGRAFELGSRNPKMLWDYGRLAGSSAPEASIKALQALLEQEPDRRDVRLTLAEIQMSAKQPAEAIEVLKPVKSISPEDAPRLFRLYAYAYMNTGDRTQARTSALRWIENSKEESEKDDGKRMIQYLDNLEQRERRSEASVPSTPPISSNRTPVAQLAITPPAPEPAKRAAPSRPFAAGSLVELNCNVQPARLVLQSPAGRIALALDAPETMLVYGLADGKGIDLACGAQKPVEMWIEYDAPAKPQPGIHGLARALHYEPPPAPAQTAAPAKPQPPQLKQR